MEQHLSKLEKDAQRSLERSDHFLNDLENQMTRLGIKPYTLPPLFFSSPRENQPPAPKLPRHPPPRENEGSKDGCEVLVVFPEKEPILEGFPKEERTSLVLEGFLQMGDKERNGSLKQDEHLFTTQCPTQVQTCNLIEDKGSKANTVPQGLEEQVEAPRHPCLYEPCSSHLRWILLEGEGFPGLRKHGSKLGAEDPQRALSNDKGNVGGMSLDMKHDVSSVEALVPSVRGKELGTILSKEGGIDAYRRYDHHQGRPRQEECIANTARRSLVQQNDHPRRTNLARPIDAYRDTQSSTVKLGGLARKRDGWTRLEWVAVLWSLGGWRGCC